MMAVAGRKGITLKTTHKFLNVLFSEDVHAKRIYSLANAALGVISSASLAVNTIGQGLALARGKLTKHAIKQVDRMLSNAGIDVDELSKRPTLMPIIRRRLCCRWSATMAARRRWCGSRLTRQR